MPFTTYFKICDKLFKDWNSSPAGTFNSSPYSILKKLDKDGMPEPFIGDPEKCSAVIVNINPGEVRSGINGITGVLTSNCSAHGYTATMKSFPYALSPYLSSKGGKFWLQRIMWINRIVDLWIKHQKGLNQSDYCDEDRLPFNIEVCPWHSITAPTLSKRKLSINSGALKTEINHNVLKIAEEAIKHSLLPCGIVIGKLGYDALREFGYSTVSSIVKTSPTNRTFKLLRKGNSKFLCILSPKGGSNQPPQPAFDSDVLELLLLKDGSS